MLMHDRSRQLARQAQETNTSQQASQEPDQDSPMQAGITTSLNQSIQNIDYTGVLSNNQIHPETLQNGVASDTVIGDANLMDDDAGY